MAEQWRPKTHTFHFPIGEATITLQDVQILWGLPINGDVALGVWHSLTPDQWSDFAGQYLGIDVHPNNIKSGHILISALCAELNEPIGETERSHQQRARVYLLAALSSFLFPDCNSTSALLNYVQNLINFERLSWGIAVLAHVYRNLCCTAEKTDQSGINGAMLLVQHWVYARIPSLAPRLLNNIVLTSNDTLKGPYSVRWYGRRSFEQTPTHVLSTCRSGFGLSALRPNEFLWLPYRTIINRLPDECRVDVNLWTYRGAILFWATIEIHLPDRANGMNAQLGAICLRRGWAFPDFGGTSQVDHNVHDVMNLGDDEPDPQPQQLRRSDRVSNPPRCGTGGHKHGHRRGR
ncbi:serine/threonine-protein phosphatase 7 long form homolog [Rutidosis leptorrhynchoides]|uniref:serine/threonine-protein phosphatase 7 long form homolog n=1 Tax=Rutidosis leptorrhynchoides TaxID=125765 RepID=UPI003A99054B